MYSSLQDVSFGLLKRIHHSVGASFFDINISFFHFTLHVWSSIALQGHEYSNLESTKSMNEPSKMQNTQLIAVFVVVV